MIPRSARPRLLALALTLFAAGCGKSQPDAAPTLRIADQLTGVQSVLTAAGELTPKDYRIQWSNFLGGPAIIAAQTGGSVDLGWMNETPLVFAQAAGSPVKVVAVARGGSEASSNIALVVAAGSPIKSVADLRGKKVGYLPGTITQYLVIRLLEKEGLTPDDITTVRLSSLSAATLDRGVVDAFTAGEPTISQGLRDGRLRVLGYAGQPLTPGLQYLVASDAALADPKRSALIGEFVQRLARATHWQDSHAEQAAPIIAKTYKVDTALAADIIRRTPTRYVPIDDAVVAAHQQEADVFHRLGLIKTRVDAAKLFDHRYDTLVAQAETAK